MGDSNRPEWAQGEEWEGWRNYGTNPDRSIIRTAANHRQIRITREGMISVGLSWFTCLSPAHALKAANALADAAGGWA